VFGAGQRRFYLMERRVRHCRVPASRTRCVLIPNQAG
jgi:hypothetical protein